MKFSLKSFLIFILISLPSIIFAAGYTYTPLLTIQTPGGGTLNNPNILEYLKNIYTFAIAIAGGLAVIKIVYGGIQYMLSDVVTNKTNAKNEITSAVIGLLVALGSATLLYTINPALLTLNFSMAPTAEMVGSGQELMAVWVKNDPTVAAFAKPGGSTAQAIAAAAQFAKDNPMQNSEYGSTNGGRTACVYTVNQIVNSATGAPASQGLDIPGLENTLQNSDRFSYAGNDLSMLQDGDIVVSNNGSRRHTGIVVNGQILNNDSNASEASGGQIIVKATNPTNWGNYFGNTKVFRPN